MKKLTAFIIAAAVCSSAFAADEATSAVYTPQKGDVALGIDVLPLFRTIGNAFAGTDETPSMGGYVPRLNNCDVKPNVAIQAKYMLTDKWGLKATLGLISEVDFNRYYIRDDKAFALDPVSEKKVIDTEKYTRYGGTFQLGAEYRVGQRRVQGVFGMGILLGYSAENTNRTFGNVMNSFNQQPSTVFDSYRIKEHTNGNFAYGVYGSTGVEWFVAPKIALGATVDLYLYGTAEGQGWCIDRSYNDSFEKVIEKTTVYSPGSRSFRFGTDNLGGSLYMTFYF